MKRKIHHLYAILPLGLAALLCGLAELPGAQDQGDLAQWKAFVAAVRGGTLSPADIRPLYGVPKETLIEHLRGLATASDAMSSWADWDAPEIFHVGELVHALVRIRIGPNQTTDRCFSFTRDAGRWYYGHMEGIFIRLDKTPPPPTSDFPDLDAATKAWQREEIYWSQLVQNYLAVAGKNGKPFALGLLKTGAGYFVAAKSWVPFLPPAKAFILYLCWDESRLRENLVVLEKLADSEAVVRMQTHYFRLYQVATHLRQWISFAGYKEIFETIWQDRAAAAGWALEITYSDPNGLECVFRFTKKS